VIDTLANYQVTTKHSSNQADKHPIKKTAQ